VKKRIIRTMLFLLFLLCGYILLVIAVNRWISPAAIKTCEPSIALPPPQDAMERVKIMSWNLGYAGLGSGANFVADGGEDLLPASRELVLENAAAIKRQIGKFDGDIIFLQEAASSSFINRNVDLRQTVLDGTLEMSSVYFPDVRSWLVPHPLNMNTGKVTISKLQSNAAEGILLPLEDKYYAGFLLREYRMAVSRFNIGRNKPLVAINIHLAAFDDGSTRKKQLAAVLEYAKKEFDKGNYVLVGGDWNLRLIETDFPHSTEEEHLFWLEDFPSQAVPAGWQLVADKETPSVRTLHQAYAVNDNYVCTVDGFLLSPNLLSVGIENLDLGFQHSDHQPVVLTIGFAPTYEINVTKE